jgi:hypothetical protein
MVFYIIELERQFRNIHLVTNSIVSMMRHPQIGLIQSIEEIVIKGILIFFVRLKFIEEIHVVIPIEMGLILVDFGEGFAGAVEIDEDILDLTLLFGSEGVELAQIALYMHELNLYDDFRQFIMSFGYRMKKKVTKINIIG